MIRRPLLWYAGAYILGEVFGHCGFWEAAGTAIVMLAFVRVRSGQKKRGMLILPFFFLAGAVLAWNAGQVLPMDAVFREEDESSLPGTVSGTVVSVEKREEKYRLRLKSCSASLKGREEEFGKIGGILVFAESSETEAEWETVQEGNTVRVSGDLYGPEKTGNPGQFDMSAYYRSIGIRYTMNGESVEIVSGSRSLPRLYLRKVKEWMAEGIMRSAGERYGGMLRAMVLGEKWAADESEADLYTEAGIGHLLAISGLHISLSGMGIYRFLRKRAKCSYPLAAAACTAASFCYFVITGEATSAKRAWLMLTVYGIGQIFGRRYDLVSSAALAAMVMLVQSPLLLFQSGFQLSFGCILALGLAAPEIGRLKEGKIWAAVSPGLAIQLVTLPAQAYSFCQIPVYGLFINLIVIPLFSVAAVSGLAGAFLGGIVPEIMRIVLIPAKLVLELYEQVSGFSLRLPGAVWRMGRPGLWQLFLYGICLALLYRMMTEKEKRRGQLAACLIALPLCLSPVRYKGLEAVFLDVGQGDCCFVRTPEGTTFLIDGGSSSENEPGKYRIGPFLDSEAVGKVDYALVSHGDEDHINGIRELLEAGRVGCLLLPGDQRASQKSLEELGQLAERAGIPVMEIGQGDILRTEETSFYCLWPEKGTKDSASQNEASMVLWLSFGSFDLLLTGDLEGAAEEQVAEYLSGSRAGWNRGKLEILKAGHHGSGSGSGERFLETVRPRWTVISCGKHNRYGHPDQAVLERLARAGSVIFRTDEKGAVLIRTDGETVRISQWGETGADAPTRKK